MRITVYITLIVMAMIALYVGGYFYVLNKSGLRFREQSMVLDCIEKLELRNYSLSDSYFRRGKQLFKMSYFAPCTYLHKRFLETGKDAGAGYQDVWDAYVQVCAQYPAGRYCIKIIYPTFTGHKTVYEFYDGRYADESQYYTCFVDESGRYVVSKAEKSGLTNR